MRSVPLSRPPTAAASPNHSITKRQGYLGQVKPGFEADLLLVEGDPLGAPKGAALLANAARVRLVLKGGLLAKAPAAAPWGALNALLVAGHGCAGPQAGV